MGHKYNSESVVIGRAPESGLWSELIGETAGQPQNHEWKMAVKNSVSVDTHRGRQIEPGRKGCSAQSTIL